MSYEIIYEKSAIKLSETEFVMFGIIGSNNCTERNYRSGRDRRVRDCYTIAFSVGTDNNFILNTKTFKKSFDNYQQQKLNESIADDLDNNKNGKTNQNNNFKTLKDINYSWYTGVCLESTRFITFNGAKQIVMNVIKKAYTFEELIEDRVIFSYKNEENETIYIKTLEEFSERVRQSNYVSISRMPSETLQRQKNAEVIRKVHKKVFMLVSNSGSLVDNLTKSKKGCRLSFTYSDMEIPKMLFGTEKNAAKKKEEIEKLYNDVHLTIKELREF